jgi:hypothetical protein
VTKHERYNRTAKGRARYARYRQTEKGQANDRRQSLRNVRAARPASREIEEALSIAKYNEKSEATSPGTRSGARWSTN